MAEARVLYDWLSGSLTFVWRRFVSVWRRLMAAADSLPRSDERPCVKEVTKSSSKFMSMEIHLKLRVHCALQLHFKKGTL